MIIINDALFSQRPHDQKLVDFTQCLYVSISDGVTRFHMNNARDIDLYRAPLAAIETHPYFIRINHSTLINKGCFDWYLNEVIRGYEAVYDIPEPIKGVMYNIRLRVSRIKLKNVKSSVLTC